MRFTQTRETQRSFSGVALSIVVVCLFLVTRAEAGVAQPIAFITIARGGESGVRQPLQMVIRSEDAWQKLWQKHTSGLIRSTPSPVVDFSRDIVIGIFAGITDRYVEISVLQIAHRDGEVVVRVLIRRTVPGPSGGEGAGAPFHIVRLPRSSLPVTFEWITRPDIYQPPGPP